MKIKGTLTAGGIAVKVWDMAQASLKQGDYYTVRTNTLEWAMDEITARGNDARKAGIKEVVETSLQFRVAHREVLGDVGEWAECQDVGRFLYIPKAKLKEWGL